MTKIKLMGGNGKYYALIDIEDLSLLNKYVWIVDIHSEGQIYAYRQAGRKTIRMHREVLDAPIGVEVDHINGNGLDNRKHNLRLATRTQNSHNTRKFNGCFKGVTRQKRLKEFPFQARICVNLHQRHLGYFKTEKDAAKAYDKAARRYFGEFSRLNFPKDSWDIGDPYTPRPVGRRVRVIK